MAIRQPYRNIMIIILFLFFAIGCQSTLPDPDLNLIFCYIEQSCSTLQIQNWLLLLMISQHCSGFYSCKKSYLALGTEYNTTQYILTSDFHVSTFYCRSWTASICNLCACFVHTFFWSAQLETVSKDNWILKAITGIPQGPTIWMECFIYFFLIEIYLWG